MIPNPILRVLSSIERQRVRALLTGGQACVSYGAAEFSRDTVHFRCQDPEAEGMRIDVMTRMQGVAGFSRLWARRTSVELPDGGRCDVMALPDLVQAKKTQRDKDWPMVRRLLEAHFFQNRERPSAAQVRFWLRELRTPELLVETAERWPKAVIELERLRLGRHRRLT